MKPIDCKCGCSETQCEIVDGAIERYCGSCGALHYRMTLEDYTVEVLMASQDWQQRVVGQWVDDVMEG